MFIIVPLSLPNRHFARILPFLDASIALKTRVRSFQEQALKIMILAMTLQFLGSLWRQRPVYHLGPLSEKVETTMRLCKA